MLDRFAYEGGAPRALPPRRADFDVWLPSVLRWRAA
jgi:hypothetical protein